MGIRGILGLGGRSDGDEKRYTSDPLDQIDYSQHRREAPRGRGKSRGIKEKLPLSMGRLTEIEERLKTTLDRMAQRTVGNPRSQRRLLALPHNQMLEKMGADKEDPIFDFREHRRKKRREMRQHLDREPSKTELNRRDINDPNPTEDPALGLGGDIEDEEIQREAEEEMRRRSRRRRYL